MVNLPGMAGQQIGYFFGLGRAGGGMGRRLGLGRVSRLALFVNFFPASLIFFAFFSLVWYAILVFL